METSILVGYFVKRDEALGAYRELQRKGFRRAAVVSKTANGVVRTKDPFPRRRVFRTGIAFILFGILAYIASIWLRWPEPVLSCQIEGVQRAIYRYTELHRETKQLTYSLI